MRAKYDRVSHFLLKNFSRARRRAARVLALKISRAPCGARVAFLVLRFGFWGCGSGLALGCGALRFGFCGLGFGFCGSGFTVWAFRFGVWGLRFRFWGLGLGPRGLRFGVCAYGLGFARLPAPPCPWCRYASGVSMNAQITDGILDFQVTAGARGAQAPRPPRVIWHRLVRKKWHLLPADF